ncbi:hypothetical protein MMC22_003332 [Lobaria immixta]|nr:hypothetical protein [Lobaria immixta]
MDFLKISLKEAGEETVSGVKCQVGLECNRIVSLLIPDWVLNQLPELVNRSSMPPLPSSSFSALTIPRQNRLSWTVHSPRSRPLIADATNARSPHRHFVADRALPQHPNTQLFKLGYGVEMVKLSSYSSASGESNHPSQAMEKEEQTKAKKLAIRKTCLLAVKERWRWQSWIKKWQKEGGMRRPQSRA